MVDRNAPPTARASACDCLANLGAGAADGVVAARLHVAAFTALATDDESSFDVKASAARALANALRPLEDVEDEAVNPSLSECALELLSSEHHSEAGAALADVSSEDCIVDATRRAARRGDGGDVLRHDGNRPAGRALGPAQRRGAQGCRHALR